MTKIVEKLDPRVEHSRLIQLFKASEYWEVIHQKLNGDWKKHRNTLVAEEDPIIRGRIQYIEELFNWVESVAEEELVIEVQKVATFQDDDF